MHRSSLPEKKTTATLNLQVNLPLLLSVSGVIIIAITYKVIASSDPKGFLSILSFLTWLFFILTVIFALFETVQQAWMASQNQEIARGLAISALFGAGLLGPLLLALTAGDANSLSNSAPAILLSIVAWITLPFVAAQNQSQPLIHDDPVDHYAPTSPAYPPQQMGNIMGPTEIYPQQPRVDLSTLPPLFENDPLYAPPRTRKVRFFAAVKGNDIPVNSEDACAISENENLLALCDGASGSSLSRSWAALLAQQWIKKPFNQIGELPQWLDEPRQKWFAWVQNVWQKEVNQRNNLAGQRSLSPSRVQAMLQQGAAATFLGVALQPRTNTLRCVALGDSCVFLLRPDKTRSNWTLALSEPMDSSARFNDRPPLLSSRPDDNAANLLQYLQVAEYPFREGDILLMATDALAQWLLSQIEQKQSEWLTLLQLRDSQQFVAFINAQRQNTHMIDDDTTLLIYPLK